MLPAVQPEFPIVNDMILPSVSLLANAPADSRGEVFTKPEVVEFMLDLIGWTADCIQDPMRLIEPSCGEGDFLLTAINRLLEAHRRHPLVALKGMILGVEINKQAFEVVREKVESRLVREGFGWTETQSLLEAWLIQGDFLSTPISGGFSHVVGNPPYLRLEALPRELMQYYRRQFATMYDRSDLYVAFFEKGLSLLEKEGRLGFICSDRWMKNKYGGPLRKWIAENYHFESYIDFSNCDAFHSDVTAYPAVTIIRNAPSGTTRVVRKTDVNLSELSSLSRSLLADCEDDRILQLGSIAAGNAPWLLTSGKRLGIVQHLEEAFPTLEEAGCKVGIGVATGADKVFIGSNDDLDVEPERKLPLITRRDLRDHRIHWRGSYVLNPFAENENGLVNPEEFPRFNQYILRHREAIQRRHVAKKNPNAWFKTIDRITPSLLHRPKLLIPDIQGNPQVAYDPGEYYPHHNLYFITSDSWDLEALQAVLRSSLAKAFIATYSLRMRGDYLRFQAQYLRRIRLPNWRDVPEDLRRTLSQLAHSGEDADLNEAVRTLYGLTQHDWKSLITE